MRCRAILKSYKAKYAQFALECTWHKLKKLGLPKNIA